MRLCLLGFPGVQFLCAEGKLLLCLRLLGFPGVEFLSAEGELLLCLRSLGFAGIHFLCAEGELALRLRSFGFPRVDLLLEFRGGGSLMAGGHIFRLAGRPCRAGLGRTRIKHLQVDWTDREPIAGCQPGVGNGATVEQRIGDRPAADDHRFVPRKITQCTGRTFRSRRRKVQWGPDPMLHFPRSRTICPLRERPRTRSTNSVAVGTRLSGWSALGRHVDVLYSKAFTYILGGDDALDAPSGVWDWDWRKTSVYLCWICRLSDSNPRPSSTMDAVRI